MGVEIAHYCPACGTDSDCEGDCLSSLFEDDQRGMVIRVVK